MGGIPALNLNLNQCNTPVPIAGDTGTAGALGGIKADGTTIAVDQTTGVATAIGGTGGISGTPGFVPKFATLSTIEDSAIDDGVTTPGVLTVAERVAISDTTTGNGTIGLSVINTWTPASNPAQGATGIYVEGDIDADALTVNSSFTGIDLEVYNHSATKTIDTLNSLYVYAENTEGGPILNMIGVKIDDIDGTGATSLIGISVGTMTGATSNVGIDSSAPIRATVFEAKTVYSVAGTALPSAASVGIGARAFVSDATSTTFAAAYVGGGANKVPVYSDGSAWHIG